VGAMPSPWTKTRLTRLRIRARLLFAAGPCFVARHRSALARHAEVGGAARRTLLEGIWREAADELGATLTDVGNGFLEVTRNGRATLLQRDTTPLDDPVTLALAADKALVHRLLSEASVPAPEHLELLPDDWGQAIGFTERVGGLVVVKPARGTGAGWGVACHVRTAQDLARAAGDISRYADRILVERQLPGDVFRILVLDGVVIDAVRRRPPSVTGDGRRSIVRLIEAENGRRLARGGPDALALLRIDLDCLLTLRSAGLTPRSVPDAGQVVQVKTGTSENRPEDNWSALDLVGPEVRAEAVAAAGAVGLRLAGVDVATQDPGRSLAASAGAVLEVNGTPGIHHHYRVADPEHATRVATQVLQRMLESGMQAPRP
jgi:D-alanine-D-alanine ligase-like ATP-grasp enzyme